MRSSHLRKCHSAIVFDAAAAESHDVNVGPMLQVSGDRLGAIVSDPVCSDSADAPTAASQYALARVAIRLRKLQIAIVICSPQQVAD